MKKAFTISEVLITLSIIGIIAVLTLPTLISISQKKTLEVQFKKAYSLIMNAHQNMLSDGILPYEDYVKSRSQEKATKQIEDFAKYFKDARICDNNYRTCTAGKSYKTLDGKSGAHIDADAFTQKTIILPNGMIVWTGGTIYCGNRYYVDINGNYKGPNKLGYDLFTFIITSDNKLQPEKDSGSLNRCSFNQPAHGIAYLGFGCAHYAALNTNPDENGKNYWQDFLQ